MGFSWGVLYYKTYNKTLIFQSYQMIMNFVGYNCMQHDTPQIKFAMIILTRQMQTQLAIRLDIQTAAFMKKDMI